MVQQNYIDSAKSGIFKMPQLDDVARMEALSEASNAVSDMDLAGASLRLGLELGLELGIELGLGVGLGLG
jgi:hypothetical protein